MAAATAVIPCKTSTMVVTASYPARYPTNEPTIPVNEAYR